jgi:hypothetical protein
MCQARLRHEQCLLPQVSIPRIWLPSRGPPVQNEKNRMNSVRQRECRPKQVAKANEQLTASFLATTHRSLFSISFLETPVSLFLVANHAGIWWPHQSCRLTHQSRMLSSHWNQVFSCSAGIIFNSPFLTASVARLAMLSQFTYH